MADQANTGIYEIVNLVNGKRYIGSAVNFKVRFGVHRHHLRNGKHHARHLQRAWIKYGEEAFVFRVIEHCCVEGLVAREQWAMDTLRPEYNTAPKAGNCLGVKWSDEMRARMRETAHLRPQNRPGWKHSVETLALLSAAKLGNTATRGKKRAPEAVAKTAAAHRGMKRSAETRARISAAMLGKKRGPRNAEYRAKLSAAHKGKPKSTAAIEKMRATKRGSRLTKEHKLKIGAASREAWMRLKMERADAQPSLFSAECEGSIG